MEGRGVDVVIATPGQLNDFAEAQIVDLSGITFAVLDEADQMLVSSMCVRVFGWACVLVLAAYFFG